LIQSELDKLARSCIGPFAFCGLAVSQAGQGVYASQSAESIEADNHTMFRVASISKIITARAFLHAADKAGLSKPLNADISNLLGWTIRHPHHPETPITIGMIASHTAGLKDIDLSEIPCKLSEINYSECFLPTKPGTYFSYSNLGYVLLAAATEAVSGQRFDKVAETALANFGITGGFNWSGVPADRRASALPTYRRDGPKFLPQIDQNVAETGTQWPRPLRTYQPLENTWAFSPQGGYRTSMEGLLALAKSLRTSKDQTALWSAKETPGDTLGGVFEQYGFGLQIFDHPTFFPNRLIGHFGTAYGFKGGVWFDCETETAFAYALIGADIEDESDEFGEEELQIFEEIAQLCGA